MAIVLLGNAAPKGVEGGEGSVTVFSIPDDVGTFEALRTVVDVFGEYHSDSSPEWVESSSSALASALAEHYDASAGRPKGWTGRGDWLTVDEPFAPEPPAASSSEEASS